MIQIKVDPLTKVILSTDPKDIKLGKELLEIMRKEKLNLEQAFARHTEIKKK